MYCEKCGKPVSGTAFYCQWCGNELDRNTEEWIIEKIKSLRRTSPEIEAAKYMARLWNAESYKTHYASFEDFAWEKLGMEKSLAYKYKDVGLNYFDDQGNCLLPSAERYYGFPPNMFTTSTMILSRKAVTRVLQPPKC